MVHRTLHTVPARMDANNKMFSFDKDINSFIVRLIKDISYFITSIPSECNVIFAVDSKDAWRKSILENTPNPYKGKRSKSKEFDWEKIYEAVDELEVILSSSGFSTVKVTGAEADDVMALLKQSLYVENDDSIIFVTTDSDIRQLIEYDQHKNKFCVVLNPISKKDRSAINFKEVYVTEVHKDTIDKKNRKTETNNTPNVMSVFETFSENYQMKIDLLDALSEKMTLVFVPINPDDICLRKIFCGDDGDNTPAIWGFYNEKNVYKRVTNVPYEKIRDRLSFKNVSDLLEVKNLLNEAVSEVMKHDVEVDLADRIEFQRTLVELNPTLFPSWILSEYLFHHDKKVKELVPRLYNNISYELILNGTRFLEEKDPIRDNQILSEINKYLKKNNVSTIFDN